MAEKPKNTQPSPEEEYQVVRLPLRNKVGSNPTGAANPEQVEPTSGPSKGRAKEDR